MSHLQRIFVGLLLLLPSLVWTTGCASSRSLRLQARDDLVAGKPDDAEKKLTEAEVLKEDKNRLLTLVELGTVAQAKGEYSKSILLFVQAKELAQKYWTTSVTEQLKTGLLNDLSATYAGMDYEISAIRYYLVSAYLALADQGSEKAWTMPMLSTDGKTPLFEAGPRPEKTFTPKEVAEYISKARAEVLDWDTYLESVRERNRGTPYYKEDLLAKTLGAYVHQLSGIGGDAQIAKKLCATTKSLALRSYAMFPTFNQVHANYVENFSKFEALGEKEVESQFLTPTSFYKRLVESASWCVGAPHPTDDTREVTAVIEIGTVPEKQARKYTIGLSTLFGQIEDPKTRQAVELIGTYILLRTAPAVGVGLVAVAATGAVMGEASGESADSITGAVDKAVGFEFQLPTVAAVQTRDEHFLRLEPLDRPEDKAASIEVPLTLINPYNDIARLNVERRAAAVATKTGVRVGLKYLAVLIPAIIAYQKVPSPEFLKTAAGFAVYMTGKKVVDATEKADARAWNTLPESVQMARFQARPGQYRVWLIARPTSGGSGEKSHDLGTYTIKSPNKPGPAFLRRRVWQAGAPDKPPPKLRP